MSILDLSKHLVYDFYYNQLKSERRYGERCQLPCTDTDSLLLEIQTEDIYQDKLELANFNDTSDYPNEHPLYSINKKKEKWKMNVLVYRSLDM